MIIKFLAKITRPLVIIFWFLFRHKVYMKYYINKKAYYALEGIFYFDYQHKQLGWNRQRRRQWWRNFIKSPAMRGEEVGSLINALTGKAFKFKLKDWLY